MTRVFIALEMDSAIQRRLKEVIHQSMRALPSVRWVNSENIHLTLAFLGELNDEELAMATQVAREAVKRCRSFSYQLTSMNIFGTLRQPRTIWIGVEEPSGMLQQLYNVLKQQLEQHSFRTEERPFSPHLTLARVKAPLSREEQQQLQMLLSHKHPISTKAYPVGSIEVVKSELLRDGAVYTALASCFFDEA